MPDDREHLTLLMQAAATGDGAAQTLLVNELFRSVADGLLQYEEAMTLAEPLARMAACHGAEADRLTLLGILIVRAGMVEDMGQRGRRDVYLAESRDVAEGLIAERCELAAASWATVLSKLANDGDEGAAVRLNELSEQFGPHVLAQAAAADRVTA